VTVISLYLLETEKQILSLGACGKMIMTSPFSTVKIPISINEV
jgi:hypothetical protein